MHIRATVHLLALAALAALACRHSATDPIPTPGTLAYRYGPTCARSDTLDFHVDQVRIATATLVAGQERRYDGIAAGTHDVGARTTRVPGYVWNDAPVTVPSGGTGLYILDCH
jgi:hypothetical protein